MNRDFLRQLRTFGALLVIVIGCAFAQSTWARERDWQPQHTWVYVVGVLQWEHRDMFNSFPQTNRRDAQFVEFFRQQGVPDEQIIFLKDAQATSRRVHSSFPSFLSKAGPNDLLILYYTGHGYKSEDERTTYFATYDAGEDVAGWATDSIVRDIERSFRGSRALLVADTCYSGSLAAQTQRLGQRVSYASLTSSSSSQESTENWTFTEMLLAGFQGRSYADINDDGEITLSELAEDIKQDMVFAEGQRSVFSTTGNFPATMLIGPAQRKTDSQISGRVEVRSEDDWYKARIVDVRDGRYHVHFFGYEDSDDEWVSARQIRYLKTFDSANGNATAMSSNDQWSGTRYRPVARKQTPQDYEVSKDWESSRSNRDWNDNRRHPRREWN